MDMVGGLPTPLKNMKINWDRHSQYKENKDMFQTTNQIIDRSMINRSTIIINRSMANRSVIHRSIMINLHGKVMNIINKDRLVLEIGHTNYQYT